MAGITDGPAAAPVAVPPDAAELWQLEMWLNPHGFLKAARLPGANPVAVWRWELGEMGRDGPTTVPERVTVVSIRMLGKYRVDATINKEHMLQRIHTWVPHPVLGDMNYEHEFTNASYVDVGNGARFPSGWHHHEGWDDNYNTQTITAGHNGFGGTFKQVSAACGEAAPVPEAVRTAAFPVRVDTRKLADGVYLLGGASHNSVAIELKESIAVIEAPIDEDRSLAVIEEVARLMPGKPIRFLVNTHQHFDHIGGLRTYLHIGATVVTHALNFDFYNRDVLNYTPRTLKPDMVALWPPTELTEGYNLETVRENYVITDGVADPPGVLRAPAGARRGHAHRVSAARAAALRGGPVRQPSAQALAGQRRHAQPRDRRADAQAGCLRDRPHPRPAGCVERVCRDQVRCAGHGEDLPRRHEITKKTRLG